MKKSTHLQHLAACLLLLASAQAAMAQYSEYPKLNEWADRIKVAQLTYFGYPVNEKSELKDFYEWYTKSGLDVINLNNAGDPMTGEPFKMSSHPFEREVINYFAPLYGFDTDNVWRLGTHRGDATHNEK